MTGEQIDLIPGARLAPPDCYDDVVDLMENARSNAGPIIDEWSPEQLAIDMHTCSGHAEEFPLSDIVRSIKIWRERNDPLAHKERS